MSFIVVVKSTSDGRVYTGKGFSKFPARAKVFEGEGPYPHMDAVAEASNGWPGSSDGLDVVVLEAGETPAAAVARYIKELKIEYRMED